MLLPSVANSNSQPARKLPLRFVLVVPFVLQIFAAVGLTGYLSLRNGQKAINDLATQLQIEVSSRIDQHLDTYLATPHAINQINADAVKLGLLNLRDFKGAGHYFWKQLQVFNVGYIASTLSTGEYAAAGYDNTDPNNAVIDEISPNTQGKNYTYATDSQGNRTRLVAVLDDYQPQKEDWYSRSIQTGKAVWSKVYSWDEFPDILAISAGYPLYDNTNKLIGVLNVDLRLAQISNFLRQLKISPSGKTFIVERNGLIVASSSTEKPFTMVNGKAQRLKAADSKDPLIRATAHQLSEQFSNLNQIQASQHLNFTLKGQLQFAQVTRWQDKYGLDWLIVVAMPESDFIGQINANTRSTILLCLLALGLATALGIYTSRWIAQPILRLSQASKALAQRAALADFASGNLELIEIKGVKELDILAESFNQMAAQLHESFTALEKTNEELEQRVEARTAELKSAKEEAEAAKVAADNASQAKSEFLANMSHELRTPLNGVLGYAQILQRDQTASTKQKDGLGIIYQCGSHLLTLINDVLDISKIEAQKLELYPTDFCLENFLRGVQEICFNSAEQKEIDFSYQALNRLPTTIRADEKRLRQVLLNLLGNAIKFTDKGGVTFKVNVVSKLLDKVKSESQIKDVTEAEEPLIHKIRFHVEDTGIGMTPEQMEKIFLPFEQVGEHAHKAEGTGLGLAISRKIVQMMGGEIHVESTYGKGSKFWFELELPQAIGAIELEQFKSKHNAIGYQGDRRTILIVDDRWENRSVIINLLEPIGFNLIEASNGYEGLEKANKFKPNLIITDLAMPVMNGFEMAQRLRESEEFKDSVIIAFSASVFSFDRQKSREAGCNDFLSKPVQASELLEKLQYYLQLRWIYETREELIPKNPESTEIGEMTIPPGELLTPLYQAAKRGYISGIEESANQLKQLDPKYTAFANKVLELAEEFEDEAIVELVKPYLELKD
ncbi:MAG TPA: hybrid sensor histidine kinase/response regulator [Cyanobacteria bacterium UBA11049]|nr:hybrid sensor histidine kinase/response regulator [Cyanobacteria bacterium UBA11049]